MTRPLERQEFELELRPLRELLVRTDPYPVAELPLPNGVVQVALSAPSAAAVQDFLSEALFGAELVRQPNSRLSSVTGLAMAEALRETAERLVGEQGADFKVLLAANPRASAAGLVARAGASVEELIATAAAPLIRTAAEERRRLDPRLRWEGPRQLIDRVTELAFLQGSPAITGAAWPPRPPIPGDPDLTLAVGISAAPATEGNEVSELRFLFDPRVDRINWFTAVTYLSDGLLDIAFCPRSGDGLEVFDAGNLGGRVAPIGATLGVSASTWAAVSSLGSTTYEVWGSCRVTAAYPRWNAG